jgi:hypothetical protein
LPIVLAVLACLVAGVSTVAAQSPPEPAVRPDNTATKPIMFYLAHGEPDACGPGCDEWIVAQGRIDADAAGRLRHLLARLRGPRPPIFLHSPGGSVNGAMELGRLIRAQKLTVSVGHTLPLDCASDDASANSCEAQIRAGQQIEAKFDPTLAMCNSACVDVLAAGVVRLVPPWVRLGIHDIGFDQATRRYGAALIALGKRTADEHLRSYLREMGVNDALLTETMSVPNKSLEPLTRDDVVRFGLDRQEFGETVWQYLDKPAPTIRTLFFARTESGQFRYINGFVSVSCAKGFNIHNILAFGRERLGSDPLVVAGQPAVNFSLNGKQIALRRAGSLKLYVRSAELPLNAFDTVTDDATIVVPGSELGRQEGPVGDVILKMDGFSAAYEKLQKNCPQPVYEAHATPLSQSAGALPPPLSERLKIGSSRFQVDAILGVPTKTVGNISLYGYGSSANERKVMAAYFDMNARLERFARYALKDGQIVDEIKQSELSDGAELSAVRSLLSGPSSSH